MRGREDDGVADATDPELSHLDLDVDALAREVEGKFISAFVRANKPATVCCAPVAAPKS